MWMVTAIMAITDFGGFMEHDLFFVSTFFGCFAILGVMVVFFCYFKQRMDELIKKRPHP